ncbi:hypothetical protein BIU82_11345 [Arthrobacter sp. SW1]|uniref:hypothetical protein n=1 Tax=Arthrobacter sp. SW1 TaxID=1920889 RepID=UPI000877C932|nr:hypothetical protein [Arthrobacter sp. SW1]OFI37000.1 hypothetical protein BIU82_11345 [Arthrobacter sp. SW1]
MSLYEVGISRPRRNAWWRWFLVHPRADLLWAAALVGIWLVVSAVLGQPLMVEDVAEDSRRTVFQTLATLSGAVAGLILSSISMLVNVLGKKAPPGQRALPLERLAPDHRRQIGEAFLSVIPVLAVLLVAALATILVEGDSATGIWPLEAVVFTFGAAAALGLVRMAWALRRLIAIATS